MKFFRGITTKDLFFIYKKFLKHTKQLFACFLDAEYNYRGSDWRTGETWNVSLSKQIAFEEKIWLNNEKKQLLGPFPPEK